MNDEFISIKETGYVVHDTNAVEHTECVENKSLEPAPSPSLSLFKEYMAKVTVGVTFVANDAQYKHRRQDAIHQLKHHLYADIIGDVYIALNSPDRDTGRRALVSALKKMGR